MNLKQAACNVINVARQMVPPMALDLAIAELQVAIAAEELNPATAPGMTIALPMRQGDIAPAIATVRMRAAELHKQLSALEAIRKAIQGQCEHPADQQEHDNDPRGPDTTCKVCGWTR